jgi:hypothetical protein
LGYIPLIQEGKTKLERPNAVAKRAYEQVFVTPE